jgi:iron complex outermembrane recepter protein
MYSFKTRFFVSGCSLMVLASSFSAASAQSQAGGNSSAAPTSSGPMPQDQAASNTGIEEIVVTAEKRSQSINKVGSTIQAITGASLREQGVSSVSELTRVVPGLTFAQTATGTPVYTLRGVGFNDQSLAAYPTVSVYVDEIPLPFPITSAQASLDVARVEVLKGPQGTLFGQNSTGGAINYIAAKPTNSFEAGADLSVSRFNTVELDGFVSGPLADTLKGRLSVKSVNGDDWQYSYRRPGDTVGAVQNTVARALIDWSPIDALTVEFNLNGWVNDSDPQALAYSALVPKIPALLEPAIAATPFAPHNDQAANWSPNNRPRAHQTQYQTAMRADYHFDNDIKLTSISSYVEYRRSQTVDQDGLTQNNFDSPGGTGSLHSFDQEIRLTSPSTSPFRWIAGGDYEHAVISETDQTNFADATVALANHFTGSSFYSNQTMENEAIFASAEYDVTDRLTFKLGGRFTEADRSYNGGDRDDGHGSAAFFTGLADALTGTMIPPIPTGGDVTLDATTHLPGPFNDKLNENNFSYSVGADYHLDDDTLLYVNVTKGYKAGSFPTVAAATTAGLLPVTQESVLDYEGGFKVQLFDHSLLLTGAGFYYDYSNKQVLGTIIDPVFGVLPALVNVPKSSIPGGEVALTIAPIAGLTVSGSATYLDAKIDKYVGVNGVGLGMTANYAGSSIPFTPEWQAGLTADYRHKVLDKYYAFIGGTLTYHSSTNAIIGGGPDTAINSYALLDLRAGIDSPANDWTLTFWGKNVTNTYYWTNVVLGADTFARFTGMPATYGATFSYRFHGADDETPATISYSPPPAVPVTSPTSYLVFFDFNKSELTPQAVEIVDTAAKNAGPTKVTQLTVTGHTDTVGSDAYNMRLSRRRAESVAAQLEKDGIASSEIEIVAKGKRDLLVPTGDGVREPQNRRVQILNSGGPAS